MVFLATKAALAATLVGIGMTFGALNYIAQSGQENNGQYRGFQFSFPNTQASPSISASFALPVPKRVELRIIGVQSTTASDCDCRSIYECPSIAGGSSPSFRIHRSCGFDGFLRKICCDDPPPLFFSTPHPQLALDEMKTAHAQLGSLMEEGASSDYPTTEISVVSDNASEKAKGSTEPFNLGSPADAKDYFRDDKKESTPNSLIEYLADMSILSTEKSADKLSRSDSPIEREDRANSTKKPVSTTIEPEFTTQKATTTTTRKAIAIESIKFPPLHEYFPDDGDSSNIENRFANPNTKEISTQNPLQENPTTLSNPKGEDNQSRSVINSQSSIPVAKSVEESLPDVTERIVHGSEKGTSQPQSLELERKSADKTETTTLEAENKGDISSESSSAKSNDRRPFALSKDDGERVDNNDTMSSTPPPVEQPKEYLDGLDDEESKDEHQFHLRPKPQTTERMKEIPTETTTLNPIEPSTLTSLPVSNNDKHEPSDNDSLLETTTNSVENNTTKDKEARTQTQTRTNFEQADIPMELTTEQGPSGRSVDSQPQKPSTETDLLSTTELSSTSSQNEVPSTPESVLISVDTTEQPKPYEETGKSLYDLKTAPKDEVGEISKIKDEVAEITTIKDEVAEITTTEKLPKEFYGVTEGTLQISEIIATTPSKMEESSIAPTEDSITSDVTPKPGHNEKEDMEVISNKDLSGTTESLALVENSHETTIKADENTSITGETSTRQTELQNADFHTTDRNVETTYIPTTMPETTSNPPEQSITMKNLINEDIQNKINPTETSTETVIKASYSTMPPSDVRALHKDEEESRTSKSESSTSAIGNESSTIKNEPEVETTMKHFKDESTQAPANQEILEDLRMGFDENVLLGEKATTYLPIENETTTPAETSELDEEPDKVISRIEYSTSINDTSDEEDSTIEVMMIAQNETSEGSFEPEMSKLETTTEYFEKGDKGKSFVLNKDAGSQSEYQGHESNTTRTSDNVPETTPKAEAQETDVITRLPPLLNATFEESEAKVVSDEIPVTESVAHATTEKVVNFSETTALSVDTDLQSSTLSQLAQGNKMYDSVDMLEVRFGTTGRPQNLLLNQTGEEPVTEVVTQAPSSIQDESEETNNSTLHSGDNVGGLGMNETESFSSENKGLSETFEKSTEESFGTTTEAEMNPSEAPVETTDGTTMKIDIMQIDDGQSSPSQDDNEFFNISSLVNNIDKEIFTSTELSVTSKDDMIYEPITEITKSVRTEPTKDKTVVELTSMFSKVKNKVIKIVTAVRSGSEAATVRELITEFPLSSTTAKSATDEQFGKSTPKEETNDVGVVINEVTSTMSPEREMDSNSTMEYEFEDFSPESTTENQIAMNNSIESTTAKSDYGIEENSLKIIYDMAPVTTEKGIEVNEVSTILTDSRIGTDENYEEKNVSSLSSHDSVAILDLPTEREDEISTDTYTESPFMDLAILSTSPVPEETQTLFPESTTTPVTVSSTLDTITMSIDSSLPSNLTKGIQELLRITTVEPDIVEEATTSSSSITDSQDDIMTSTSKGFMVMNSYIETLKELFTTETPEDLDDSTSQKPESMQEISSQEEEELVMDAIMIKGNSTMELNAKVSNDSLLSSLVTDEEITTSKSPKMKEFSTTSYNIFETSTTAQSDLDEIEVNLRVTEVSTTTVSPNENVFESNSSNIEVLSKEIAQSSTPLNLPEELNEDVATTTLRDESGSTEVILPSSTYSPEIENEVNVSKTIDPEKINATTSKAAESEPASSSFLQEIYDTLFGPSGRSARVNSLNEQGKSINTTSEPLIKTTTTPEPPFKIQVKVGPYDSRALFSSDTTAVEKELEGEISNVVGQLLLTTHSNFHLLPNFVECAGARGRTGRRKTKVLQFDTDNYPWMARIGYREPGGVLFPCAGTIISHRYILTSAHCASRKNGDAKTMEILLEGAKNVAAGMFDQYKYKVEEVIVHPNYNKVSRENDLAIIRLASAIPNFNGSSSVKPICLPFEDGYGVWDSLPGDGDTAYLGGWGYGLKNMAATVEEMEEAAVTIWPNKNCTYLYRGDRDKKITPQHICAYGKAEKDACRGDKGGPLMALMTRQKIFFQIGVVSYGPRCGYGVPGVYVRVKDYLMWLLDSMRP